MFACTVCSRRCDDRIGEECLTCRRSTCYDCFKKSIIDDPLRVRFCGSCGSTVYDEEDLTRRFRRAHDFRTFFDARFDALEDAAAVSAFVAELEAVVVDGEQRIRRYLESVTSPRVSPSVKSSRLFKIQRHVLQARDVAELLERRPKSRMEAVELAAKFNRDACEKSQHRRILGVVDVTKDGSKFIVERVRRDKLRIHEVQFLMQRALLKSQ